MWVCVSCVTEIKDSVQGVNSKKHVNSVYKRQHSRQSGARSKDRRRQKNEVNVGSRGKTSVLSYVFLRKSLEKKSKSQERQHLRVFLNVRMVVDRKVHSRGKGVERFRRRSERSNRGRLGQVETQCLACNTHKTRDAQSRLYERERRAEARLSWWWIE